jgi:hypothetical protein
MIRTRIGLAAVVAVAAMALATGAALALSGSNGEAGGEQSVVLVEGTTSSGDPYTITQMSQAEIADRLSRTSVRVPSHAICLRVEANGMGGAGCNEPPEAGTSIKVTQTTLGDDMIVRVLADDSVDAIHVRRVDGQGEGAVANAPIDVGGARLFHVVLHVPADTLPTMKDGVPTSPTVEVEALDSEDRVQDREVLDLGASR